MSGPGRRVIPALSLAALIVIFGPGGAEAGIVVGGTIIMPTGDPLAQYDFQLSLTPNTVMENGDFITLLNIPDFDTTTMPTYVFISGMTNFSGFCTPSTSPGTDGTTDVTLTFTASNPPPSEFIDPTGATSNQSIGDLYVSTTADFPPPPGSPLLNPINYISHSHTDDTNMVILSSGTTIPMVVPEPASLMLVGAGLGSSWVLARRRRRVAHRG